MRRIPLGKSFGVMQGRLSEQTSRGYQAFPTNTWQEEFWEARKRGLEHIEWVVDSFAPRENPLLCTPDQVQQIVKSTGVEVRSLCADFLMDTPLTPSGDAWEIFLQIIEVSRSIGIEIIVIPAVDQASAKDPTNLDRLKVALSQLLPVIGNGSPSIALETDLAPGDFLTLLDELAWDSVSVNYDSGNSASLGYDQMSELSIYGHRVSDIHIKDRLLAGPSVFLGEGVADLDFVLSFASESRFGGLVTMQAFRDREGLEVLDRQLQFLEQAIDSGGRRGI